MPLTESEAKAVMESVGRKGLPVGFRGGAYEAMMFGVNLVLQSVPGMGALNKKPDEFPPPAQPVPNPKKSRKAKRK